MTNDQIKKELESYSDAELIEVAKKIKLEVQYEGSELREPREQVIKRMMGGECGECQKNKRRKTGGKNYRVEYKNTRK